VRELVGIPPYSGDASNARVKITGNANDGSGTAEFDATTGSLLYLSATWSPRPDPSPIQKGDFLELPGGRLVAIDEIKPDNTSNIDRTKVSFNLRKGRTGFDDGFREAQYPAGDRKVRYKIHRRPVPSSTAPYSLPRGVVVDLNYSGMQGTRDHYDGQSVEDRRHFAPKIRPPDFPSGATNPIDIIFGPDGHVESVTTSGENKLKPADGIIFLCVGDADGVQPDNLLSTEKGAIANLLNLESKWVVINPSTGRITSAPFASVQQMIPSSSMTESIVRTDPNAAKLLNDAISDTRLLTIKYSDTEDME
jgi:hypothetical protein